MMHRKYILFLIFISISFSAFQASIFDDLKDELKKKAEESLEDKKQDYGLSDGNSMPEVENVSLVFSGSTNSSTDTFKSLHTNAPTVFIPQFTPVILATGLIAPLKETECFSHIQGKIAWDPAGKAKTWAASNVKRLCKGTTSVNAPGNCFKYAMRSGSSWGKTSAHNMGWSQAIDLCEGIANFNTTTTCFKQAVKSGKSLTVAIKQCERK